MDRICLCGHHDRRHKDVGSWGWGEGRCENGSCDCQSFELDKDNPLNKAVLDLNIAVNTAEDGK